MGAVQHAMARVTSNARRSATLPRTQRYRWMRTKPTQSARPIRAQTLHNILPAIASQSQFH